MKREGQLRSTALSISATSSSLATTTYAPQRPVSPLDGDSAAPLHADIPLTINAPPDDRLVIIAVDARLHHDTLAVAIRAIAAAVVRLLIAVTSVVRGSAVAAVWAATIAAVRASANLHAEARYAETDLSIGRRRDEKSCSRDRRCRDNKSFQSASPLLVPETTTEG